MDSRRSGACACGAFTVTVAGEPVSVQACSCFDCQKRSGSAFSYTAFFADEQLSVVSGEARRWRRSGASGNAVESAFCPLQDHRAVVAAGAARPSRHRCRLFC